MGRITLARVGAEAAAAGGSAPAPFDAGAFRRTLGRFATGVTLVTAADASGPVGLIVNAFNAVSLEPPLIAICPSRHSFTWSRIRRSGRFGVNMLAAEHHKYVRHAAQADADRFIGIHHVLSESGRAAHRHIRHLEGQEYRRAQGKDRMAFGRDLQRRSGECRRALSAQGQQGLYRRRAADPQMAGRTGPGQIFDRDRASGLQLGADHA